MPTEDETFNMLKGLTPTEAWQMYYSVLDEYFPPTMLLPSIKEIHKVIDRKLMKYGWSVRMLSEHKYGRRR